MASTICMATAPVVGSSFELFSFRAISFFSLPPTPIYSFIFHYRACRLDRGVFLALGGLPGLFACPGRSLAAPVLDMPNHLSTYPLVHTSFLYGLTVCEH